MTSHVPSRLDGDAGEYPQDLYRSDVRPPYSSTVEQVLDADVARFNDLGFLAVRRVLGPDAIRSALDGLQALLLHPRGADLEFEAWALGELDGLDGDARFDVVRKLMFFVHAEERLGRIAADETLLGLVRRLVGSEDVVMLQDMALLKPPGGGREKPWHQDNAFFNLKPDTPTLGVWIALDEATPGNGCMHVMPGSHLEGPAPHFKRRDWQICDADVATSRDVVVPLAPGGALFFHGLLHHGTPANRTNTRRRALQFHYVPRDAVQTSEDERLSVFGWEGRGARC